jgi:hypothetical protein
LVLLESLIEIAFLHFAKYVPEIFDLVVRLFNHGERFVLSNVVRRLLVESRPQIAGAINGVGEARHRDGARQGGINVQLGVIILVDFQRMLNFL